MLDINFKMVPLNKVVPSPTNPRKTFDESKTMELAESIREKGVLQPILLREKGNKFEIVCGERRYRASLIVNSAIKDRNTIPAIVRELSDQEVREMQLIENFQREDVHPMEEALAIKYAVETGQYTIEELRLKVGKSITYIKQRMKLNDLSDKWQKLFFNGNLNISEAIQIAMFQHGIQDEILSKQFDFDKLIANPKERVHGIDSWTFSQYRGRLKDAKFDLSDSTLNPVMGACTACIYNTGNAGLFPESADDARCTVVTCFRAKSENHITKAIEKAKEDPAIIFVSTNWSSFDNEKLVAKLSDENHLVYTSRDYEELDIPEQPSFEEFAEDWKDDNDGDMNGCEEAWLAELESYNVDLKEYEDEVNSGSYLKALIVDGRNVGAYILVKLNKKISVNNTNNSKVDPNSTDNAAAELKNEIDRIKTKEERSKELDAEKIWKQVDSLLRNLKEVNFKAFPANSEDFSQVELNAIGFALAKKINLPFSKEANAILGCKDSYYIDLSDAKKITNVTKDDVYHLLRLFMISSLSEGNISHLQSSGAYILYPVLNSSNYLKEQIDVIEDSFMEKVAKRITRVNERIDELKEKIALLKPKKAKPSKKAK